MKNYPPASKYQWVAGPYVPPAGDVLHDEMLGEVEVLGHSKKLHWPLTMYRGQLIPVLCEGLVRAVCEETEQAVAHYWEVTTNIVNRWRMTLAGCKESSCVHTALALKRYDPEFRKKYY